MKPFTVGADQELIEIAALDFRRRVSPPTEDWRASPWSLAFPDFAPGAIRRYHIEHAVTRQTLGLAHARVRAGSGCEGLVAVRVGFMTAFLEVCRNRILKVEQSAAKEIATLDKPGHWALGNDGDARLTKEEDETIVLSHGGSNTKFRLSLSVPAGLSASRSARSLVDCAKANSENSIYPRPLGDISALDLCWIVIAMRMVVYSCDFNVS